MWMIKMRMIRHRLKRKIGLNIVRMGMMRMVLLIMMIISYLVMSILFALLSHHCGYQLSSYLKSKRSSRYRQKCQDLLSEYYYQLTWASSSWELRMFATRNIKRSWPFLKLITFKCQLQSEISWSTLLMFLNILIVFRFSLLARSHSRAFTSYSDNIYSLIIHFIKIISIYRIIWENKNRFISTMYKLHYWCC